MPAIVDYPEVVHQAVEAFHDLFSCEPQRRHFAEYLTGLILAQRKTVSGIHREFADITDSSCLNHFLTASPWNANAVNHRRLQLHQLRPETRYSARGVIAIDNTLLERVGLKIPYAGKFWDHVDNSYKIAQDLLFVNYVCPSGLHYPLDFRFFRKEADCQNANVPFQNHTQLTIELFDWVCDQQIPGDFTFDNYFSSAEVLNHVHGKTDESGMPRAYIADFKTNRNVVWKGKTTKISELAESIDPRDRKPLVVGNGDDKRTQWYFTVSVQIPRINHRVRILILWNERSDKEPRKVLGTNRITWEANRIVWVYRDRWTGTETFHRDGKQELGMGDCQLRDYQGQTRHIYLVMLAYSLLINPVLQGNPQEWLFRKLQTIGEACRTFTNETLRKTIVWVVKQIVDMKMPIDSVLAKLRLA